MNNNSSLKQVECTKSMVLILSIIGMIMIAIGSFITAYPILTRKKRWRQGKRSFVSATVVSNPPPLEKAQQEWKERKFAIVGITVANIGTVLAILGILLD